MTQLYLLAVTAIFFLQLAAWVPGLVGTPLFQVAIIPGLVLFLPGWVSQLGKRSLASNPISVCVLSLFGVTFVSEAVNRGTVNHTFEFAKPVLFYLLLTGLINTREKLLIYLQGFASILFVLGLLILLVHLGILDIGSVDGLGTNISAKTADGLRFRSLGANFDANDTSALLVLGTVLSLHFTTVARSLLTRSLWLATACVDIHILQLTDSRGGFLALMVGLVIYLWSRWGKRGLLWGSCLLPIVVVQLVTERMAGVSSALSDGTGQNRLQYWETALVMFRQHPLLGLGPEGFVLQIRKAAHNSFLQAFAELGFVGGTLFLGAFAYGFWSLLSLQRELALEDDESTSADRITLAMMLAIVGSYAMAILALNHLYGMNTYILLAVVTITTRTFGAENSLPLPSLLARLCALSAVILLACKALVVLLVRY